jgi:hypothetical protein
MDHWDSVERLLCAYCDEAQSRESLHRKAYYRYKSLTTCFQLPVIILSAIAGSATFLSKGYPDVEEYITNGTAALSIGVSIISAVASYLKLGETKSKHEIAEVSWQNFYNGIKHELSLARSMRQDAAEYIQDVKTNYDRLFEISPICNRSLIKKTRREITKGATKEFRIPNYLNGWSHTTPFDESDMYEDNSESALGNTDANTRTI